MLATLIAATFIADNATANDFFPLAPGSRRMYEEKLTGEAPKMNYDEVHAEVDVKGVPAVRVATVEDGKEITNTYYKVDKSSAWIIGNDIEHPLPKPMPILQFGDKPMKWSYEGPSDDSKLPEPITLTGESRILPDRMVLGKKVSILEVKLTSAMGGGSAQERVEQVALYGKGIGLVQLTSKTMVGKRKVSNELKLIQVEEAKTGG